MTATSLWIVLCGLLSIYTTSSTSGDAGAAALLAVLMSLMLFLYITALCVLIGAEVDSTLEHFERQQRAKDDERVAAAMTNKGKTAIVGALLGAAVAAALGRSQD
jgi:uncharacterized BrkB/YihY/UPF0761 family membrane protein